MILIGAVVCCSALLGPGWSPFQISLSIGTRHSPEAEPDCITGVADPTARSWTQSEWLSGDSPCHRGVLRAGTAFVRF